jgi:hypothetical protein
MSRDGAITDRLDRREKVPFLSAIESAKIFLDRLLA